MPADDRCTMGNQCLRTTASAQDEDVTSMAVNRVELAASELFSLPGVAKAYHTSVLVNGEEYFFSDSGIVSDRMLTSHQGTPTERLDLGYSSRTGIHLLRAMQEHFQPMTYDLIRKNCNSFSDCALHFLVKKRLDKKFTKMERLGMCNVGLLKQVTNGMYTPNEVAANFQVEAVIADLDAKGDRFLGSAPETNQKLPLSIGMRVTIMDLNHTKELNGQQAEIVRYNPVNGRWEAKLPSGEIKAIRIENLRPEKELALSVGDRVRVHGLQSESGKLLNGLEGEVIRYVHESSRYEVSIGSDVKALRSDNLKPVTNSTS